MVVLRYCQFMLQAIQLGYIHNLTKLQLVQDGRLSGGVKTNHQDSHLLLSPQAIEQFRERETHVGGVG